MLLSFHSSYISTIEKVRINLSAQLSWPESCIFIVFPHYSLKSVFALNKISSIMINELCM